MFQRIGFVALVALSYGLVLLSGSVLASSDSSTSSGCVQRFIGDGDCDLENDNAGCGYDGGDCCECTCVDTIDFICGEHVGFLCLDPSAPCFYDNDDTTLPGIEAPCVEDFHGDGLCDDVNNNEKCDYDGGDCCECTCVDSEIFVCGDRRGFACLDPSAPCLGDNRGTTLPDIQVSCEDPFIADGDCDAGNNFKECGYDGGDCCECTCVSTEYFTCGHGPGGGFACLDPSASCVDYDYDMSFSFSYDMSLSFSYDMSASFDFTPPCINAFIGDGDCDAINNNEECGYDGGDCCECTCLQDLKSACGFFHAFDCVDPEAPCVDGPSVDAGTQGTFGAGSRRLDGEEHETVR